METTIPSVKSLLVRARMSLAEAAEARQLSCDDVRRELAEVAEGLKKASPAAAPPRARVRGVPRLPHPAAQDHDRDGARLPIGPLLILKKLALAKLGGARARGRRRRRSGRRRRGGGTAAGAAGATGAVTAATGAATGWRPARPRAAGGIAAAGGVGTGRRRDEGGRRRGRHRGRSPAGRSRRSASRHRSRRSPPSRLPAQVQQAPPPVNPTGGASLQRSARRAHQAGPGGRRGQAGAEAEHGRPAPPADTGATGATAQTRRPIPTQARPAASDDEPAPVNGSAGTGARDGRRRGAAGRAAGQAAGRRPGPPAAAPARPAARPRSQPAPGV